MQIRLLREQFSEFLDPGVRVLHRRGMNFVETSYNVLVIANQKGILMACSNSVGTAILKGLAYHIHTCLDIFLDMAVFGKRFRQPLITSFVIICCQADRGAFQRNQSQNDYLFTRSTKVITYHRKTPIFIGQQNIRWASMAFGMSLSAYMTQLLTPTAVNCLVTDSRGRGTR